MAQKPHRPTKEGRRQVRTLAGMGTRYEDIGKVMGVAINTLKKHYPEELERAVPEANARVAQALFKRATEGGPQAVTACIFWLKCRAGWKETSVLEHVGAEGGAIEVGDARTELAGLVKRQQEAMADAEANSAVVAGERKRRKKVAKKKKAKRVSVRKKR